MGTERKRCSTCGGSGKEQNYQMVYGDTYDRKLPQRGYHTCPDCDGSGYVNVYVRPTLEEMFDPSNYTNLEDTPAYKEQVRKFGETLRRLSDE